MNVYSIKFCVDFKKYDLLRLLASWQKPLDKVGFVGYDYLPHYLLLAGFPFNKTRSTNCRRVTSNACAWEIKLR